MKQRNKEKISRRKRLEVEKRKNSTKYMENAGNEILR